MRGCLAMRARPCCGQREAEPRQARGVRFGISRTIGGNKRRVFVSFDVERDRLFRNFFYREGRDHDATWHVSFTSNLYEEIDPMWISTAIGRVKQCEALVVLRSSSTYRSPGVLKEVATAHILQKSVSSSSLWRGQPTHHPQHW
mgnify:CR=1 FL=1